MTFKLTEFSHGGGCGCKIAPNILSEILKEYFAYSGKGESDNLISNNDALDDAAVFCLSETQALVATTDFFMPIVDDAYDFGKIAAANALSDIYAMGAKPLFALNIVGFPVNKIPSKIVAQILAGGAEICREAGIMIAGGHSIDTAEPIYGLAVIGITHPSQIKSNATAQADDVLILGKPLGLGILSAAFKQERLKKTEYQELVYWTTKLNRVGEQLGALSAVHAMTDVTGFGLLGHLSEICQASQVSATLDFNCVPLIASAQEHAEQGVVTGAMKRNLTAYQDKLHFPKAIASWQQNLLLDPQTSGGLLVSCAADSVEEIITLFQQEGFDVAQKIGVIRANQHVSTIQIKC